MWEPSLALVLKTHFVDVSSADEDASGANETTDDFDSGAEVGNVKWRHTRVIKCIDVGSVVSKKTLGDVDVVTVARGVIRSCLEDPFCRRLEHRRRPFRSQRDN